MVDTLDHVERRGGFPFASTNVLPFDGSALDCEPAVDRLLEGSMLADAVGRLSDDLLATARRPVGARS